MGWYDGMDQGFASRLQAFIEASGGRIGVGSGYRSIEEQTYLWERALAEYGGNADKAREWVAPPGKSNHNHGVAADLSYETDDAQAWAHANAPRFGLIFPMEWEPWHLEPIGVRDGNYQSSVPVPDGTPGTEDAYTTPPPGHMGATDGNRRFSLEYQLMALNNMLMSPDVGGLATPDVSGVGSPDDGGMLAGPGGGGQTALEPTPALES